MGLAEYKLCDICGAKVFYDAHISDSGYVATYDPSEGDEPIGIAVLCWQCNKTHEAVIQPRTAQPAAPEERRTGLRLVMVAATLLDQEDLPDEPSAILCGSIDAIRSLGGLLGDPVDVLPAQPAAPVGDA